MFLDFINEHIETQQEELLSLQFWLKKIGNEIGAKEEYFRYEGFRGGDARALPPPSSSQKRHLSEITTANNLRLYCMRINKNVVLLFSGAIKTKNTAQDCDNVRPHFLLANRITKAIDEAVIEKDIQFDKNDDLVIPDDFILKI